MPSPRVPLLCSRSYARQAGGTRERGPLLPSSLPSPVEPMTTVSKRNVNSVGCSPKSYLFSLEMLCFETANSYSPGMIYIYIYLLFIFKRFFYSSVPGAWYLVRNKLVIGTLHQAYDRKTFSRKGQDELTVARGVSSLRDRPLRIRKSYRQSYPMLAG